MNPEFNDQNNQYQGKTLFDSTNNQPSYPQPIPTPPPHKRHGLLIIAVAVVVVSLLIAALYFGLNSAKNQTQVDTSSTQATPQQTQDSASASQAADFMQLALANKADQAWAKLSPQFQSSVTREQFNSLLSTLSKSMGGKSFATISSNYEDGSVQFDNPNADDASYQATAYVFDVKVDKDSATPDLYAQVKVANVDGKWQIYAFEYQDAVIQPKLDSTGKFQIVK